MAVSKKVSTANGGKKKESLGTMTSPSPIASQDLSKFVLYDFAGKAREFYLVGRTPVPTPTPTPEVTEHIVVVDVSGSMCGVIHDTRAMVEKVFTLDEYNCETMKVSLISYSSRGDVSIHFERVSIADIMRTNSPELRQLRTLEARGMTCASQAFELALKIAEKATGTVGISLHTDGFFNDPSPMQEMRSIEAMIAKAAPRKNLFVNTIAYGWADYVAMSKISNAMSGKCVKCGTVKEVYDALHDTQALLAGRVAPSFTVPTAGADYITATNVTQKKINGTTTDLTLKGGLATDEINVFRYNKISEEKFMSITAPMAQHGVIYAFARAKLAEGKLNEAKFALCSTMNATLLERHAKALTNTQLTAFGLDLEVAMFGNAPYAYSTKPGLANSNALPLTQLFQILNSYKEAFTVDLVALAHNYRRMGVKKIKGHWSYEEAEEKFKAQGLKGDELKAALQTAMKAPTFSPVDVSLIPTDDPADVRTGGFEFNNAEATVNLLLTRPAKLVENGKTVHSAGGVKLDKLSTFNNYTIVSGGDLNVKQLPVKISKLALFNELKATGMVAGIYSPTSLYLLDLAAQPGIAYDKKFLDLPADLTERMAVNKFLISLCDTLLKLRDDKAAKDTAAPTGLTQEQEEALSALYLSPKLYFSPPMRNPYVSKEIAVKTGLLDFRTRYKIEVGDKDILSLSDVPSANKFFGRRFVGQRPGDKKPGAVDLSDAFDPTCTISVKDTAKLKLGAVDKLLFPLMEAWVKGDLSKFDSYMGVPADARKFVDRTNLAQLQIAAKEIRETCVTLNEDDYSTYVRPLAFYIGSSGLIPDGMTFEIMDSAALTARFPGLEGSPSASYFVSGTTIISLYAESVEVLTEAGLAEVKRLSGGTGEEA